MQRNFTKAVSASLYEAPGLLIALRHAGANLKDVLRGWVEWQRKNVDGEDLGQDYDLHRFGLDFSRYLREEVVAWVAKSAPYFGEMVDYFEVKYSLQRGHITDRTVFCQFEYDVPHLNRLARTDAPWPTIKTQPTGVLFVNLAFTPAYGFAYLELCIPQSSKALIKPGDEIEIPDLVEQLQTFPKLIIFNRTQKRVFMTKHHMTPKMSRALGLAS